MVECNLAKAKVEGSSPFFCLVLIYWVFLRAFTETKLLWPRSRLRAALKENDQ